MKQKRLAQEIHEFAKWARKKLGIQTRVRIRLRGARMQHGTQNTFGGYDFHSGIITVATAGRHPIDIMRTIAHEMCHQRQHELKPLVADDGQTGSDIENQANAIAGILMREWGKRV